VRSLPEAEPAVSPNNEQFQQMLAMMGPPPVANGAPAPAAAAAAAGA
jgi:hypothetical protein